jgi:hypothetical protein
MAAAVGVGLALPAAFFSTAAFRTVVKAPPAPFRLSPESPSLFLGSCFAENIGGKLERGALPALSNPSHGIVYNPLSLAAVLERIASGRPYAPADLRPSIGDESRLISYEHHSRFGGREPLPVELDRINCALAQAHEHLRSCDAVFLTLGTAWAFTHQGDVVANCHKQPASLFQRQLVSADEAAAALSRAVDAARALVPGVRVVLTVSPVRHWKDGAIENSLSKATLVVAAHSVVRAHGPGVCAYLPAYEWLMDDLRDYRFYGADMLHPSDTALEYVYSAFADAYLTADARELVAAAEGVRRAAAHVPMDVGSAGLAKFAAAQLRKMDALQARWGERVNMALADERVHFERLGQSAVGP